MKKNLPPDRPASTAEPAGPATAQPAPPPTAPTDPSDPAEAIAEKRRRLLALRMAGRAAETVPASQAQQALWAVEQMLGPTPTYHISRRFTLAGPLDATRLEAAFRRLIDRHASLRTGFVAIDGVPMQRIAAAPAFALDRHPGGDATGADVCIDPADLEREVALYVDAPFDLARPPLVRAGLFRLAPEQHELVLVVHHLVGDGWSMGLIVDEVGRHYGQQPVPAPVVQFADWATAQRSPESEAAMVASLDYWKERLAGIETLQLPIDHPRPARPSHAGARRPFALGSALSDRLQQLARRQNTTLFMLLLAAFQTLLMRHSNQTDVVVGTPVAGRPRKDLESVVGYLVNMVALRTDLGGNPPFAELLDRVRQGTLAALRHQALPFDRLVAELKPRRDGHGEANPVFQTSFAFHNQPEHALALDGIVASPRVRAVRTAMFDLSMDLRLAEDGIVGFIEYREDLFEPATIARWEGHFLRLLDTIASEPQTPIRDIGLMSADEYQQVTVGFNSTEVAFDRDATLPSLIEAQVRRSPYATALVCGEESLTYDAMNRRANRLAHHLRTLGVGRDDLVAVCLPRGIDMVVAMLAILKAGAGYLPLAADHPPERIAFMVGDASVRHALVAASTRALLAGSGAEPLCLQADAARWAEAPDTDPAPVATPDSLAYIIYTSGSTGKPKGVLIEHRGLVNNLQWQIREFGFDARDRHLQRTTAIFDASMWELWTPLMVGATEVVADEEGMRDPRETLRLMREHRITFTQAVPSFLSAMIHEMDNDRAGLPDLRLLAAGGEALSVQDAARWSELCGAELVNTYGPTECTIDATFHRIDPRRLRGPIPIGRPMANTRIYILDAQRRPVPIGITGELYIASAGMARGYLNRPALDAEKFVPDVIDPQRAGRLYRTGDIGRFLPNGDIDFQGRIDHQVKVRGYRIELGEIESALLALPGILQAIVLVQTPEHGQPRLAAWVAPGDGEPLPDPKAVRAGLAQSLPAYMIPAAIRALATLPRLPNGKLDRHALPDVDGAGDDAPRRIAAPRSAAERRLVPIWAEALGLPEIGIDENFFDLGGHSLLALRLLARVEAEFGQRLRLSALFEAPTIAGIARLLDRPEAEGERDSVVAVQPRGTRAPLFFVSGYGGALLVFKPLAEALGPDQPLYVLDTSSLGEATLSAATLPQIATRLIADMRRAQPVGPYHLCGFSQGGKFVYEMAQQLRAMGESVGLLAMLDCNAPGYPRRRRVASRLVIHARHMFGQDLASNLRHVGARIRHFRAKLKGGSPQLFDDRSGIADSAIARDMQACADAITAMWRDYEPQPYDGALVLIRASVRLFLPSRIDDDRQNGWGPMIGGGVTVRDLEALHQHMLDADQAPALARILLDYTAATAAHAAQPAPAAVTG